MGKRNEPNPLCLPLPKWASFQNDIDEPGRDFPAGPYHRMVTKLYGVSANSSIRFNSMGEQPSHSIDEPRQEAVPTSLYSQGKLTHVTDETRLGNASVRFYSVGRQCKYSIGEAIQEAAPTRLHSGDQHIQSLEGARKYDGYAGFYPAGVLPTGGDGKEDETTRLHSGGNLILSDETKLGTGSVTFYPVGVKYANGARQEDVSIGLLSGGQLARSVDERNEKGASSSRFNPAGFHSADGTSQIRDPGRSHLASSEPKHPVDEPKPDILLDKICQVGQPTDLVCQGKKGKSSAKAVVHEQKLDHIPAKVAAHGEKLDCVCAKVGAHEEKTDKVHAKVAAHEEKTDKIPAKVAAHEEKTDKDPAKVAAHEEKLEKVSARVASAGGNSVERGDKAVVDNAPSGVIFMCNKKTRTICFQYSLFGLPIAHSKLVQRIVPQTKLFLFVLDTRELHGVFEAASNGGLNLEPRAFGGSFPSQVRFRILRECKPLLERDFRKAIEANYYQRSKFNSELTAQQVADLLQMFCPAESLEKKVETQETHLPDPANIHGMMDCAVSEPAECQSELSMEISPQNSPAVDSFQRSLYPPFNESQRGAQPWVVEASREISRVQGVRGHASMEDLIVGGQGVQSLSMERLSCYLPSVEGSMLNKSHYKDGREDFQTPLTADPMLVQSVGFQKNTESYLREASRQGHHSMVDQFTSVHNNVDIRSHARGNHSGKALVEGGDDMRAEGRDYLTSSRFEDSSYTLETGNNVLRGSLQPSSAYSSGLRSQVTGSEDQISRDLLVEQARFRFKESQDSVPQPFASNADILPRATGIPDQRFSDADVQRDIFNPQDSVQHHISSSGLRPWSSGLQGQKLSHVDVERGSFSSLATMMGNAHQLEQNRLLYETDHSKLAEGKGYINELEVGRRQHLERALHMFEKELNESMNPRGEELDCSVSRLTERDREQEEVEGKPIAHSFPGRLADASSFQTYKRMSEDPVGSTSNSYPWKRQACYTEPYEDKLAEGRFSFVDEVASSAGLKANPSHAGNNIDESNSRKLFSNVVSRHDPREFRSLGSQPSQASGLFSLSTPMARSTFPMERY